MVLRQEYNEKLLKGRANREGENLTVSMMLLRFITIVTCALAVGCNMINQSASPPGLVRRITVAPFIKSVAWTPDGQRIAVGASVPPLRIIDANDGHVLLDLPTNGADGVAWSPDGKYLASASLAPSDTLHIWEITTQTQSQLALTADPPGAADSIAWSHDGKRLAVGIGGETDGQGGVINSGISIYNEGPWQVLATLTYTDFIGSVTWSPDDKQLAFGSSSGSLDVNSLVIWDTTSKQKVLHAIPTGKAYAYSVAWSPISDKLLAASFNDGTVGVWDITTGQRTATLMHGSDVKSVAWSPDGKRLASGGQDNTAKVWDPLSSQLLNTFSHPQFVNAVAWSPDGKFLATGCDDNAVWVWDVK